MDASLLKNLNKLETTLGHSFKDSSLLKQAITHKSYAHENKKTLLFNERMEFMGDSVLELIISEYLYLSFPEYTEADLSRIKAYTVQEVTLAKAARALDIGKHLLLGNGEEITGGRKKSSLLADAFEAIIAAIYLDSGYAPAKKFVLDNLKAEADEIATTDLVFDFKTKLQELSQSSFGTLPHYTTHSEEGPEHKKIFEIKVHIKGELYGTGQGRTKKAAEQKAAKAALEKIKNLEL